MKNSNYNIKQKSKGFTLIEVAVVSSILLLVVGFLGYLSVKHFWIYNSQIIQLNVESDARGALDDIDNYVRGAYRVLSSYGSYTTGSQILILQVPSIDLSNQIIASKYDTIVFYLSGTSLVRQAFPDASSSRSVTAKTLSSGVEVSSFMFSYDNINYSLVKQVSTAMTIKQGSSNYERTVTISSKSSLRNY